MRVPENALFEQRHVLVQLREGVQTAAGVIEVDLIERVQAGVLAGAQVIQDAGGVITGVRSPEGGESRFPVLGRVIGGCHGGSPSDFVKIVADELLAERNGIPGNWRNFACPNCRVD